MITSDGIGTRELLQQRELAGPLVRAGNSRPMTDTRSTEIERIVREVLAELKLRPPQVRPHCSRGG